MPDLNESKSGALAAVSRYLGDHLKIGVGYNFTDFSDDLTDLSYDHHGAFLNLTGSGNETEAHLLQNRLSAVQRRLPWESVESRHHADKRAA